MMILSLYIAAEYPHLFKVVRGKVINRKSPLKHSRRKARELANGNGWTKDQWLQHKARHGNACLRCGTEEHIVPDHVIPLCRGGRHDLENIQPLCLKCNLWKASKTIDFRKKLEEVINA